MNTLSKTEQKSEFIKCAESVHYFVKTYVKITHPMKGEVPFDLYDFQERVLNDFEKYKVNIILKSRQVGMTTLVASYALWLMIFGKNKSILAISLRQDVARDIVRKIKYGNERLPDWLKGTTLEDNRLSIRFSNGSETCASTTTKFSGVASSLSLLIIDEAALIENAEELWASAQPALSTGGNAIVISTPRGVGNWFHKIFSDAEEGGKEYGVFHTNTLPWHLHPERDAEWRRIAGEKQGNPRKAAQEYDCSFLSSGNTIIEGDLIEFYIKSCTEPIEKQETGLHTFVTADPTHKYMIGGDPSSGFGMDNSACVVLDISSPKPEVVASYKGKIPPTEFANRLVELAQFYGEAPLVCERSGLGLAVTEKILDLNYPGLIHASSDLNGIFFHRDMESFNIPAGFSTNIRSRPLVLAALEEYLREKLVILHDERIAKEILTFVEKGGKLSAASGYHDDLLMALSLTLYTMGSISKRMGIDMVLTKALLGSMQKTSATREIGENKAVNQSAPFYNSGRQGAGKDYWKTNIRGQPYSLNWLL